MINIAIIAYKRFTAVYEIAIEIPSLKSVKTTIATHILVMNNKNENIINVLLSFITRLIVINRYIILSKIVDINKIRKIKIEFVEYSDPNINKKYFPNI